MAEQHPGHTWSASRLGMMERCPYQFYQRYVLGKKIAPSGAMALGSAMDLTANEVYEGKIKTGETLNDVEGLFASKWDVVRDNVDDWEEDPGDFLDDGVKISRTWRDQVAEHITPIEVQPQRTVDVNDRVAFLAIADLVMDEYGSRVVADLKVKKRKMPEQDVARSLQVQSYPFIFEAEAFEFHAMIRTKTPQKQIIKVETGCSFDPCLIRRVEIADRNMEHALQSGDFYPNRSHMMCSKKWCGYWQECQAEFGGSIPE